jgi:hypothetical protein
MAADVAWCQRNLSNCESGWNCDHSLLTVSETTKVNRADHRRNAENCQSGWGECDHSKLTAPQARQTAFAERQRNKAGEKTCDYSNLTPQETKVLTDAEHKRNYTACIKDHGYCDLSRLTAAETRSIPANGSSSR